MLPLIVVNFNYFFIQLAPAYILVSYDIGEPAHTYCKCISIPAITYRNPCTLDNGKVCEHSCLRLPNTVICTCPDGHYLHRNRYKCIGKCIIFTLKTSKQLCDRHSNFRFWPIIFVKNL